MLSVLINSSISMQHIISFKFVFLNIFSDTFGKGYLAPIDYIILLLNVLLFSLISIGLYHSFLSYWIGSLKHPLNLRLIFIGLAITLISIFSYTFIIHVYLVEIPFKRLLWPNLTMFIIWILYTVIISIWGKQITRQ